MHVFTTYTLLPAGAMKLHKATEETIAVSGYCNVQLKHITVEDVYYILTLHAWLVPVIQLDRRGLYVTFTDNTLINRTSPMGNIVTAGKQIHRSYELVDGAHNSGVYT